jgi:hypothetical protein
MGTQLKLMLSAVASHAKTYRTRGQAKVSPERARVSGSSSTESSIKSARSTQSSKMLRPFAVEDWIKCSGHSIRSGMTRNGTVYPLQPLVPTISGTGCGFVPTPRKSDAAGGGVLNRDRHYWKLVDWYRNVIGPGPMPPIVSELFMGFPAGWTELQPAEIQPIQLSRKSSEGQS